MEPSTTPWRVLEDPPATGAEATGKPSAESARSVSIPRSALLTGGLAVVLAIGAFVLAFGVELIRGRRRGRGRAAAVERSVVAREPGRATWSVGWQGTRRRDRRRGRSARCLPPAAGSEGRRPRGRCRRLRSAGRCRACRSRPEPRRTRCTTGTRSVSRRATTRAGRPRARRAPRQRRPPDRSTSTRRRPRSSMGCPASVRSPRPRSSPRATSSHSPLSRTCGHASSSARRRSDSSRTS